MARSFQRGRKSLREQRIASVAAQKLWAAGAPHEKQAAAQAFIAEQESKIKPKRVVVRKPSAKPKEASVLKAIIDALRTHPKVASVERNQSGVFREGERWIRVGSKGKLDLTVYLRDGRYMELEVKRPGEKLSDHQIERIRKIRQGGGLADWARSVEQARAIIEGA